MRKAHYLLNSYLCKKINFAKDIWAHPPSRGLHLRERAPVFFIIYRWPCPQLRPSVLRGLAHTQHSTLPRGHENPTLPPFQPFISPPSSPVYFRRACPYYRTAPDVLAGSRRLTLSRLDDEFGYSTARAGAQEEPHLAVLFNRIATLFDSVEISR